MGCDDRGGNLANGAAIRLTQSNINTSASRGDDPPWSYFDFRASRVSSIYGRASTIRQDGIRLHPFLRIR